MSPLIDDKIAQLDLLLQRSPIGPEIEDEITRTPIIAVDAKSKKEDKLVRKLADKLIATQIDESRQTEEKPKKTKVKNLIFEDDENTDRFSTPPKGKPLKEAASSRTPLGSVGNNQTANFTASTPKSKFSDHSMSRIPVSARRLH